MPDNTKEYSEYLNRYLSAFNHEVLTPLNMIQGPLELAIEGAESESQKNHIDQALNACKQLKNTVKNLTALFECENGKSSLEEADFDIYVLLEDIINRFEIKAQQKHLGFRFVLDGQLPRQLNGDSLRLTFVLNHLLENALTHTDSGGFDLRITSSFEDNKDSINLEIVVSDTGKGINTETAEMVLKPIGEKSTSDSDHIQGLGVGLSLCSSVISLMGGNLKIQSKAALGAQLSFTIPFNIMPNQQRLTFDSSIYSKFKVLFLSESKSSNTNAKNCCISLQFDYALIKSVEEVKTEIDKALIEDKMPIAIIESDFLHNMVQGLRDLVTNFGERLCIIELISKNYHESDIPHYSLAKQPITGSITPLRLSEAILRAVTKKVGKPENDVLVKNNLKLIETASKKEKLMLYHSLSELQLRLADGNLHEAQAQLNTIMENWQDLELQLLQNHVHQFNFEEAASIAKEMCRKIDAK